MKVHAPFILADSSRDCFANKHGAEGRSQEATNYLTSGQDVIEVIG